MSDNWVAFYIGLFGSIHCIGMCGPLAFAVPVSNPVWWRFAADKVLYNLGRVVSYSLLGLIIGLIGRQMWLFGFQQGISILSGLLIALAGFSRIFKLKLFNSKKPGRLLVTVNKFIVYAIKHHAGNFAIGVLNGLLPCGFVYIALLGAVYTNSPQGAVTYMFWFGMGTFPLMFLATLSSGFIGNTMRRRINTAIPYFMVCLGLWFVMRGLALNIPYLSPAKFSDATSVCK